MNRYLLLLIVNLLGANICSQDYNYPLGGSVSEGRYAISKIPKTRSSIKLPRSISLKKYCPFVGQQSYLDCTAWACSYSALTIHNSVKNQWTNRKIITDFSYSVSFIYNQLKQTDDCETVGISIETTLNLLKEIGCLRQKEFGYGCDHLIKNDDYGIAMHHKIDDYFSINNNEEGQIDFQDIKKALAENIPVIIAIDAYKSFSKPCNGQSLWSGELDYKRGIHALTIIGYDDESESFELMNSWGKDWGVEGFIRVKYSDLRNILLSAYIIKSKEIVKKITNKTPSLLGQIKFENEKGEKILITAKDDYSFKFSKSLASNSSFRIINQVNQPGYFYIIGSDLQNNDNRLFPSSIKESAYIPFSNSEMSFPNLGQWIELDEVAGTDYLCIIFSKYQFSIESFLNYIERSEGPFLDRCVTNIENKLMLSNQNFILKKGSDIHFKLNDPNKSMLIFFVEIEHDE